MDAPPDKENIQPFMAIGEYLANSQFSAPKIVASDQKMGLLLLEDLGDDTFSRLLKADIDREAEYYEAATKLLAAWHRGGLPVRNARIPSYTMDLLMREVMLLPDWFLPQIMDGEELIEAQKSYAELWRELLKSAPLATDQFVHRDFHADNLMWLPTRESHQRIGLLDFQDAVAGDAAYDLVSLLEDARRDVPPALAQQMVLLYMREAAVDMERFRHAYALLAAQRNSKIVGIFTRLAARDGKAHYINFLPRVWGHLTRDAEHAALIPLRSWLDRYVPYNARGIIPIRKDAQALGLVA